MGDVIFTENLVGVHVWSPLNGEHTLCGDAFDAPATEDGWEDGPFRKTSVRTVSCPKCRRIILALRGVRVEP